MKWTILGQSVLRVPVPFYRETSPYIDAMRNSYSSQSMAPWVALYVVEWRRGFVASRVTPTDGAACCHGDCASLVLGGGVACGGRANAVYAAESRACGAMVTTSGAALLWHARATLRSVNLVSLRVNSDLTVSLPSTDFIYRTLFRHYRQHNK
jgi:hypothetical protein